MTTPGRPAESRINALSPIRSRAFAIAPSRPSPCGVKINVLQNRFYFVCFCVSLQVKNRSHRQKLNRPPLTNRGPSDPAFVGATECCELVSITVSAQIRQVGVIEVTLVTSGLEPTANRNALWGNAAFQVSSWHTSRPSAPLEGA